MTDNTGDVYVSFELSDYYDADAEHDVKTWEQEDSFDVSISLGGIHIDMTAGMARQLAQDIEDAVSEVDE